MKKIIVSFGGAIILLMSFFIGYSIAELKFFPPHFHANFALYINGERFDFSGDEFMEDIAGCGFDERLFPKDRAHLHENNPDTIHIHDDGVAWGHFFSNNNILFSDNFLALPDGRLLQTDEDNTLTFILNGESATQVYNTLIASEDQLIISYGNSVDSPGELFVSDNAGSYNAKYDPGTCSSNDRGWLASLLGSLSHSGH